MIMTWLNRLLIALPLVAVASLAGAEDKKPAAPAAPSPVPAPVAKPALESGATGTKPVGGRPMGAAAVAPPAGASTAAAGPPPVAQPAPKPAPELDQLKFLLGKWRCDGKQFASPMFGPEHSFKAVAENKTDLDGFWDQFTYEEKKSKEHRGFKVRGLWGWDQGGKHLIRAASSSDGNWDAATSPGLEGDKMVWTGEFSGPLGRMPFKHTFTKKSDKEWSHLLEIKDPTGKWNPTEDVTCKK